MAVSTLALVGAGIAAAAGVTSSIISGNAAKSANEKNEELLKQQQSYQTSERLAAQEYNTPAEQRARFEAAGINPYMALGNINGGNTSAQSSPGSPNIVPEDFSGIATALGNAPNNYLQNQTMLEQINAQKEANYQSHVDSLYKERDKLLELRQKQASISESLSRMQKNTAEYDNMKADYNRIVADSKMRELELRKHSAFLDARNNKERNMADLIYKQNVSQTLQNAMQEQINAFLPNLQQAQLKQISAQTFSLYQSGVLSHKQSELTDAQKQHELVKALGTSIQNQISSGNLKIQELGMSEKELDAMRKGDILKQSQNRPIFRLVDGCLNWLVGVPAAIFK